MPGMLLVTREKQMLKLKRNVEKQQETVCRRILNAAALIILAAGLIISSPVFSVHADTADMTIDVAQVMSGSETFAGSDKISIEQDTDKVCINIIKDGNYKLTGSYTNDGSGKDVVIHVMPRCTADLKLDALNITNVKYTMFGKSINSIAPISVEGIARIHILNDSSLYAANASFALSYSAELEFVDSANNAQLTVGLSMLPSTTSGQYIIDSYGNSSAPGQVSFYNAKVVFTLADKSETLSGSNYEFSIGYLFIGGKGFSFGKQIRISHKTTIGIYQIASDSNITFDQDVRILDENGISYTYYTVIEDMPAGTIVQLDNLPLPIGNSLLINDGKLYNAFVPGNDCYFYIKETDDTVSRYRNTTSGFNSTTREQAYKVTIKSLESNEDLWSYHAVSGTAISFLPDKVRDGYLYDYYLDDGTTPVHEGYPITGDTTVYAKQKGKEEMTITVDNGQKTAHVGDTLSQLIAANYINGTCAIRENNIPRELLFPDSPIRNGDVLTSINLEYNNDDGIIWFTLKNAADINTFATLTNAPNNFVNICGKLCADVELSEDFPMIATNIPFKGIFDGNGHTVTLNIGDKICSRYPNICNKVGFFRAVGDNAEIKNLITTGTVYGTKYIGGLIGAHSDSSGTVRITKCTNFATISKSTGDNGYIGGLIGASDSTAQIIIENCANHGNFSSAALADGNYVGGIIGYSKNNNSRLINCINSADVYLTDAATHTSGVQSSISQSNCYSLKNTDADHVKNIAAFNSGEVTYLLNKNKYNNVTWYQTCGTGFPSLTGDAESQTVYGAYENCATSLSFKNSPFGRDKKGHEDKGDTYTCENKVITAKCKNCGSDVTATVNIPEDRVGAITGVTISYSDAWKISDFPDIVIKYSSSTGGVYVTEQPTTAGTWYIKAYVGNDTNGVIISDTYVIKEKTPDPLPPGGGSDNSYGGMGSGATEKAAKEQKEAKGNTDNKTDDTQKVEAAFANQPVLVLEDTANTIREAVPAVKKNGRFVDETGAVLNNCFVIGKNGKTYFADADGKAVKSTIITVNDDYFFCNKNGVIIKNSPVTLTDGARMLASKSGAIITKSNSKVKANGKYYLTTTNGVLARKQIVETKSGKMYYADKKGRVVMNETVTINGIKYSAGKSGVLTRIE